MPAVPAAAVALVKHFEGCRLKAYLCPAGVWTIGYGATGPGIAQGTTWTQAQADARLSADLARFADGVDRLVSVPITQNQRAALISFAFNVGLSALAGSTLLRLLNAGASAESVGDQFTRWNKAGGRVLDGLVERREAERKLFLSPNQ